MGKIRIAAGMGVVLTAGKLISTTPAAAQELAEKYRDSGDLYFAPDE